jgi:outer membrane protein assembly factor BamB
MLRGMWMVACGVFAGLVVSTCSVADETLENWHQWRGPTATGFTPDANPPISWNEETGENIKWKIDLPGRGSSTPIIWGDKIFILTAIKTDRTAEPVEPAAKAEEPAAHVTASSPFRLVAQTEGGAPAGSEAAPGAEPAATPGAEPAAAPQNSADRGPREGRGGGGRGRGGRGWDIPKPANYHQFVVMCIDRNTGKTLWQKTAAELLPHEGHHQTGSFAAGSPVTDGKHVYVSFGSYGLFCYDLDGNLRWQKDLGDMKMRASFGEGASPTLAGDRLVLNWDHEAGSKVYVLDAKTGDVIWERDRDEASTWNTPLVTEFDGKEQVILNGTTRVRSYDLATGDLLWECGGQTGNPIPSPMRFEDTAIVVSGFRGAAAYAIPLSSTGDLTDTDKVAWSYDKGTPYVSCAALVGDRLFFTKDRAAIVSCLNAKTGEPIINQKRLPALDDMYASPVSAGGRVYFTGRNGGTVVIDATKDDVEVLAENKLDDTIDASPAIVGDEIFIRGEKKLYCIAAE